MNRHRLLFLLFALAASIALGNARAADIAPGSRITTVTRLVKQFLELETALSAGLHGGNATAVEPLLADDFELRAAAAPGNPTPRAEWLRLALANPGPAVDIEQMAVHDYGEIAVVSFQWIPTGKGRRDVAKAITAVDVWRREPTGWKLAVRYAGPATRRDIVIPGASTEPPIDKRY